MIQSTPGPMQETPPMRYMTTRDGEAAALMKITETIIITSEKEFIEGNEHDSCGKLVNEVALKSV